MRKGSVSRDESGKFITPEQATRRYNLSRCTVMKLANEAGAAVKFGKSVRFNTERIDSFLEQQCSVR